MEKDLNSLHKKMSNYISEYSENFDKMTYEDLKKFTIETGCELFNKKKKDFNAIPDHLWGNFVSEKGSLIELDDIQQKCLANYLCLCNLMIIRQKQDMKKNR